MSDYTKATNFTAKDSLTTGDPSKIVHGSEIDTEFTAIETAIATKSNIASPTFTGTVTLPTTAGNRTDSGDITHAGTVTMSSKSMYWSKGADIASAATLVLGTDGNYFDVTGSTGPITSITVPAGMLFMLQFDSTPTLTHNATTLNLPGGANITAVAGDRLIAFATAANTVHVIEYIRGSGRPIVLIDRADLDTTTASWTESIISGGTATRALTGGTYSWWTMSGDNVSPLAIGWGTGNAAAGTLAFFNAGGSTHAVYGDERYIVASPPYTHGPCFVFLGIKPDNSIPLLSVAIDPPWAYHGPTDITPQYVRGGKKYRKQKTIGGINSRIARKDKNILRQLMTGKINEEETEVEVTLEFKDSDMSLIPHPFMGSTLDGATVVMLEPGSKMMERFEQLCLEGDASEVRSLISDGYLILDNTGIQMPGPPGVSIIRPRWKLT